MNTATTTVPAIAAVPQATRAQPAALAGQVRGLHQVHGCIASEQAAAVYIGEIIAGLLKNESLYFVISKDKFTNDR